MTVSLPAQQVCLLRKAIPIPTGHGTGQLIKGEIVTVISSHGEECTISLLMDSSQVYTCHEKNLKTVPYDIVKFLLPVIPCSRRYEAFSKLDKMLLTLPMGSLVNISRGRQNTTVVGELKYRGEIKDRLGVWFGLKLVGLAAGCGDSDGSIKGVFYMERCPVSSVVFATIDEISIKGSDSLQDSTLSMLSNMGDIKDKTLTKVSKTLPASARARRSEPKSNQVTCNFCEGDQVIVLKKKLPAEPGVVRAVFQDAKKQWILGIELDNPVGDSNGMYKGRQMFTCEARFGIFCDTTEAMPKHYYESPRVQSPTPASQPNHNRSASYGAPPQVTAGTVSNDFSSPPPNYNDTFNSHPVVSNTQSREQPIPRSPKPARVKSPKHDFESAFRMRSPTPSNNKLPADLVHSINTLSLAGGSNVVEDSMLDNSHRVELASTKARSYSPKLAPETPDPPPEIDYTLEVGSMIQVSKSNVVHYGVLRWIGHLPGKKYLCAGLELEEEISPPGNNGMYEGVRYFTCPPFRALFCYLHDCSKDRRFEEMPVQPEIKTNYFGPKESPVIEGKVDPPKYISPMYIGRSRGIQGNKNSCYLDATLYGMFAFTNTMDYILSTPVDGHINQTIQKILRESVVNPLRECGFVGADHMRILRDLMSKSSTLVGLEDEEKEPEELLNVLFTEIFNIKPLLSFRDGANEISHVNLCQILLERDPHSSTMPHTQDLLTRYFVSQNLFFHTQPDLLLLQVPRSGKDFKLYDTVLPSAELQLGGLCGGVWGSCYICNKKPFMKCPQCYINQEFKHKYSAVPYCEPCCTLVHSHPDRQSHVPESATNPTHMGTISSLDGCRLL
ncbi:ubiquitin carboxyl-terminal hydrolase CYLD-like [Bolinopsis microptera]|uniref:ubiquitin carboxyl-terminal hydrolase CYLD-like n=1 Tax=Bolinopsis microptera TaxID=2820187 RepID=UPI00307A093D